MIEQQLSEIRAMLLGISAKTRTPCEDSPQERAPKEEDDPYSRLNRFFGRCTEINEELVRAVRLMRGGDFDSVFNDPEFSIDSSKTQNALEIDPNFLKRPKRNMKMVEQIQKKKTIANVDENKETDFVDAKPLSSFEKEEKDTQSYFDDELDDIPDVNSYGGANVDSQNGSAPKSYLQEEEEDSIFDSHDENSADLEDNETKEDYSSELDSDERPSQLFGSSKFHFVELDNPVKIMQQSTNQYDIMDSITRLPMFPKK